MASFDDTLKQLSDFARSDDPISGSSINGIVYAYFARFDGNKALERDRIANAFADVFGRRTERFDLIYKTVKGID